MKKLIAITATLFIVCGAAIAGPPTTPRPGQGKPGANTSTQPSQPSPSTAPDQPGGTTQQPQPVGGTKDKDKDKKDKKDKGVHGQKKGWNKNPHNPHHAHSDNPGHAKRK